jgi:hypothetical protein
LGLRGAVPPTDRVSVTRTGTPSAAGRFHCLDGRLGTNPEKKPAARASVVDSDPMCRRRQHQGIAQLYDLPAVSSRKRETAGLGIGVARRGT